MSKSRPYREVLMESLSNPVQAKHYLRAVLEDYPEGFLKALRNVARANQMSRVAVSAGLQRESLYRSLSDNGNPTWDTLTGIATAVGLKFTVLTLDEDPYTFEKPTDAVVQTQSPPGPFASQAFDVFISSSVPVKAQPYQMQQSQTQDEETIGCLGVKILPQSQLLPKLKWFHGENNGNR